MEASGLVTIIMQNFLVARSMEVHGLPEHDPHAPPARHMRRGRQAAGAASPTARRPSRSPGHQPPVDLAYRRKRAVALSISVLVVIAVPALILALVLLG